MTEKKEDQPEDRYRDDPKEFAASADSVQRGSNVMSGGGVESSAEPITGMSRGSQEDWRPDPEAKARNAANDAANDDPHPQGHGDDPARGSDGGIEDEGSADDQDADEDGGTSKVAPNNPQSPDDRER